MCSDTMRQSQQAATIERDFECVELQRAGGMVCLLDTEGCNKRLTRCLFPRALWKIPQQTLPFLAIPHPPSPPHPPIFFLLLNQVAHCFPSHDCSGICRAGGHRSGAFPALGPALLSLSHCVGARHQKPLFLPVWLDRAEVISL